MFVNKLVFSKIVQKCFLICLSNIFDIIDSIDIGLQFDGSELFHLLKIENTLAHFISLGN